MEFRHRLTDRFYFLSLSLSLSCALEATTAHPHSLISSPATTMTTATIECVPPTTHAVPKPQRVRLMRSVRKLSALLGTTPFLADPREPTPTAAPVGTHERAPTITSVLSFDALPAAREPESAALIPADHSSFLRPVLLLRINTVSPGGRPRAMSQAWGRPASLALTSGLPSPTSPKAEGEGDSLEALLAARRRKMARLTRTLGERVPPELVFPPRMLEPTNSVVRHAPSREDSCEKPSLEKRSLFPPRSLERSNSVTRNAPSREDSYEKLTFEKHSLFPPCSLGRSNSVTRNAPSREDSCEKLSLEKCSLEDTVSARSLPFALPLPLPAMSSADKEDSSVSRSSMSSGRPSTTSADHVWFPSVIRRSPSQRRPARTARETAAVVKRKEAGWSGEWNHDENVVLKGLRELKE
ncbi:hypothetical protein DFH07DRAFT_998975 [Mycena maculata]|uniref:Uncharacterized protein n=1 Tax=Mycena maculata TaxID=230809 RepID=A0AAD7HU06_9AGAR|nr:hypothetical protein DFH07DRAFT_998975 [Mycena maculata]